MSNLYGGATIYGGGYQEAARFLLDLARHPLTKRNICKKLALHLLGRSASSTLQSRCMMAYGEVGDLPAMYASLLMSPEFWAADQSQKGFKTPFEYTVSVYRALGFAGSFTDDVKNLWVANSIGTATTRMGLPLFNYGPPTDYPVYPWIHRWPDSMMCRDQLGTTRRKPSWKYVPWRNRSKFKGAKPTRPT